MDPRRILRIRMCKAGFESRVGQPTLTEENFRLVLGKIREACRVKSYITTEELEHQTGLDRNGLLEILKRMEKAGKILQYHQGCWKLAS